MRPKLTFGVLAASLLLAGAPSSFSAQIIVANTNDDGPGSLRQAITSSGPGDTITFASGLSGATIVLTSGKLLLTNNLTIDASALPGRIQISGNSNSRIFQVASNYIVVLNSLTIRDGSAPDTFGTYPDNSGGGILNNFGNLTITNCIIANNQAVLDGSGNGGGIENYSGTLAIYNSTISNNAANYYGGGIENDAGTLTIYNSTISGNATSSSGGGIENDAGSLVISNSTISGNATSDYGGGIENVSGTLTIYNSMISSNVSGDLGGGIDSYDANDDGFLTIINRSTFVGNSAASLGGGIEMYGTLTLNQCTFTANSCAGNGGAGIDTSGGVGPFTVNQSTLTGNFTTNSTGVGGIWGDATISNTIVAGNNAPTNPNLDAGATITVLGVNLTNGAPLVALLGNYGGPTPTMPPTPGSPAIDGCNKGTGFTTDQRGFPRVAGAYADIGAVEGVFIPKFPFTGLTKLGNGSFQFGFTNLSGPNYTVLATTNIAAPVNTWSNLGSPVESPSGTFQFTDPQAPNYPRRFYRVELP